MKITYKKLEELQACEDGLNWFENEFGTEQEVEFKDLIKCNCYEWIRWLIARVPTYQTTENLEMYLAMKPGYRGFDWLISKVPAYQTVENLNLYLSMKPDYTDFSWLIREVPAYRTKENYEILKQMKENL